MADDFEVVVQGVSDFLNQQDTGGSSVSPPLTRTASSHGVTLRTSKGLKIAGIQNWSPSLSRTIDTEYEISGETTGEPLERIPQIISSSRVSIDRYELYASDIGKAFGTPVFGSDPDLVSLARQIKPLHVREVWRDPYGGIRAYIYTNAWFSDWGITIAANDDRIIKVRATLEFERRLKLA